MSNINAGRIVIQEGKVKKGGVIGNPTSPKPDIKVQGMGGGSSSQSTSNVGKNGSQSNLNK